MTSIHRNPIFGLATVALMAFTSAGAQPLAEHQKPIEKAPWQQYSCLGGKTLRARYHAGEAFAMAQVEINKKLITMDYSPESDETFARFTGHGYMWAIDQPASGKNLYSGGSGMLTHAEMEMKQAVDVIQAKGCDPVRSKSR